MRLRNKKTGKIVDVESLGHAESWKKKHGYQVTLSWATEFENLSQCKDYTSLAELNADWEDVEPAEPLIKDEKIRKAVRAWAEANNSTKMVFDGYHLASDENGNDIEFSNSWAENVIHGEWYTIAELCGEEKE